MDKSRLWTVISGKFAATFEGKNHDNLRLLAANKIFEELLIEYGFAPEQKHTVLVGLVELLKANRETAYAMGIDAGVSLLKRGNVSPVFAEQVARDFLKEAKGLN